MLRKYVHSLFVTVHAWATPLSHGVVVWLLCVFSQSFATNELLDRIAVVVNEQVITLEAFEQRLAHIKRQLATVPEMDELSDEVLRKKVLHTMIEEQTILQFAEINGWTLNEEQLESALQTQANAEGKKLTEWLTSAVQNGISKTLLLKQVELQILITKIRHQIIEPSIHVSRAEIEAFLSERLGSNARHRDVEVQVAHILIKWPKKTTEKTTAHIQSKMEKVQQAILDGKEFSDLAAQYSDFDDAHTGGLLGWLPIARLPDMYQEVLHTMGIGEVSTVLKSTNGLHLIKLIDRRSSSLQSIERIQASHILLNVDSPQEESRIIEEIKNLKRRLDQGEDFAALARNYSQDLSASDGGNLGWLYPGDTVPIFEKTLDQLKLQEISEPIRSSYGWHLIKQTGRETVPLPEKKARNIARRAIHDEKIARVFHQWVNDQVASAYIKYYIPQ